MKKFIRNSLVTPQAILAITILILVSLAVGTPSFDRDVENNEFVFEEVVVHSVEGLTLEEVTIHATGAQR